LEHARNPQVLIVIRGELARETGPWVKPEYRRRFQVPKPVYECSKFKIYWMDMDEAEKLTYHATNICYFSILPDVEELGRAVTLRDNGVPLFSVILRGDQVLDILPHSFPAVHVAVNGVYIEERETLEQGEDWERYKRVLRKLDFETGEMEIVEEHEDIDD